jgi:hypothetical protein
MLLAQSTYRGILEIGVCIYALLAESYTTTFYVMIMI